MLKCPEGQGLKYTVYGDTVCDCKSEFTKWRDQNCYKMYRRGPCKENEYLSSVIFENLFGQFFAYAECTTNICKENEVYVNLNKLFSEDHIERKFGCIDLDSEDTCDGLGVYFDEKTFEPVCNSIAIKAAFTAPELSCPQGEIRISSGQCVRPTRRFG